MFVRDLSMLITGADALRKVDPHRSLSEILFQSTLLGTTYTADTSLQYLTCLLAKLTSLVRSPLGPAHVHSTERGLNALSSFIFNFNAFVTLSCAACCLKPVSERHHISTETPL